MNDKAKVRITLESDIDGEVEKNNIGGEWYRKGSTVFIEYEEVEEGGGEVRTLIRWRDGELSVTRRGHVESHQLFAAGVRRGGQYASPHASFYLETETSLLWAQFGDMAKAGPSEELLLPRLPMLLERHYRLLVDDEPTGDFVIRLRAEEETGM